MKNSFKLALLALTVAVSVAACGGPKKEGGADTTVVDSTVTKSTTVVDSTKKDTVLVDSAKKDTAAKM